MFTIDQQRFHKNMCRVWLRTAHSRKLWCVESHVNGSWCHDSRYIHIQWITYRRAKWKEMMSL